MSFPPLIHAEKTVEPEAPRVNLAVRRQRHGRIAVGHNAAHTNAIQRLDLLGPHDVMFLVTVAEHSIVGTATREQPAIVGEDEGVPEPEHHRADAHAAKVHLPGHSQVRTIRVRGWITNATRTTLIHKPDSAPCVQRSLFRHSSEDRARY